MPTFLTLSIAKISKVIENDNWSVYLSLFFSFNHVSFIKLLQVLTVIEIQERGIIKLCFPSLKKLVFLTHKKLIKYV